MTDLIYSIYSQIFYLFAFNLSIGYYVLVSKLKWLILQLFLGKCFIESINLLFCDFIKELTDIYCTYLKINWHYVYDCNIFELFVYNNNI